LLFIHLLFVADACKAVFQHHPAIQMCYNMVPENTPCTNANCSCEKPGFGFVLDELVVAPLTKYGDCGHFHNNDLLSPDCLRNSSLIPEDFDRMVFSILDHVSGRSSFTQSLPVTIERFHFLMNDSGQTIQRDSAFLAINKRCKPGTFIILLKSTCTYKTVVTMLKKCLGLCGPPKGRPPKSNLHALLAQKRPTCPVHLTRCNKVPGQAKTQAQTSPVNMGPWKSSTMLMPESQNLGSPTIRCALPGGQT
jgi:hypothetical protein